MNKSLLAEYLPLQVQHAWYARRKGWPYGALCEHEDSAAGDSIAPMLARKCVFVHVPRTAGISVARALFGSDHHIGGGHYTAVEYARYLGPARFGRFFKFGFVRNPWGRFYSAYRFLVKGGFTSSDRRFRDAVLCRYASFADFAEQWLPQATLTENAVFRPQTYWILFRGRVALDFVGRFENLASDYSRAARRLGVTKPLHHANNASDGRNYREAYTPAAIDAVARAYRQDRELFMYTYDEG